MRLTLFVLLALCAGASARFVAPAEGPVPFRRDELSIDVDTMSSLSRQLTIVAQGSPSGKPEQRRRIAQSLALALALDPANRQARDLAGRLAEGGRPGAPSPRAYEVALSRSWHLFEWLRQPEAGQGGQALAACLGDVLASLDPQHPLAGELAQGGEKGAWDRWVAGRSAFAPPAKEVAVVGPPKNGSGPDDGRSPEPEGMAALKLEAATVLMPAYFRDLETQIRRCGLVQVNMRARIDPHALGSWITVEGLSEHRRVKLAEAVEPFLAKRHGKLPRGLTVSLALPPGYIFDPAWNDGNLSAAAAVVCDSIFSGKRPTVAVMAEVDQEGSLKLPSRFWEMLDAFRGDPPPAMVIPAAASDLLAGLLTLERADLLFRCEFWSASDLAALCDLAGGPQSERMIEAHRLFGEIQAARGTRSLGSFVAHESVQQRLRQILDKAPENVSAHLLLQRGTAKWSPRLDRFIYARELRTLVEPAGEFFSSEYYAVDPSAMATAASALKESLEKVEKVAGSLKDRDELHGAATDFCKRMGILADDLKDFRAGKVFRSGSLGIEQSFRQTEDEYFRLMQSLAAAAGEESSYMNPYMDAERRAIFRRRWAEAQD